MSAAWAGAGFVSADNGVVPGGTATLSIDGVPRGALVSFVGSPTGLGAGPCPPILGGACLGILSPVMLLGTDAANNAGHAELRVAVPANLPLGRVVGLQAVVDTPGGYVLSAASTATVANGDTDGDGVPTPADCNDRDSTVHPGAQEVCVDPNGLCTPEGLDQDCDGVADDGCGTYHSGAIAANEVWGPGNHAVGCGVTVPAGRTLGIADGATVRFGPQGSLMVNGRLVVAGTDATDGVSSHVTFTSDLANPAPGDWYGLTVDGGTATITGLDLAYAGKDGLGWSVFGTGASVTLAASRIRDGGAMGLYVGGEAAVTDSVIERHQGFGIQASGDLSVLGSEVLDNGSDGIVLDTCGAALLVDDTTVSGNQGHPVMVADPTCLGALSGTNRLTGNGTDSVRVRSTFSVVSASTTWNGEDVPFDFNGQTATVLSPFGGSAALTLGPGVWLRNGALLVGATQGATNSSLQIAGSAAEPVRLEDVVVQAYYARPMTWDHVAMEGTSRAESSGNTSLTARHVTATDTTHTTHGVLTVASGTFVLEDSQLTGVDGPFGVFTQSAALEFRRVSVVGATTRAGGALMVNGAPSGLFEDVTVTNPSGVGVDAYLSGPFTFRRVSVSGAVGAGVSFQTTVPVTVEGLVVTGTTDDAGWVFRGEGISVGGSGHAFDAVRGLVATGNVRPMLASSLDLLDTLGSVEQPILTGNTVDEIVIPGQGVSTDATLHGVGIHYRLENGLTVTDHTLTLLSAQLLVDGPGVAVWYEGELIGSDCDITTGINAYGNGIDVAGQVGFGSVLSLTRCDVSGFGGSGVRIHGGISGNQFLYPDVAIVESGIFQNDGYGIECDYGCAQVEATTGLPLISGNNLIFDNGLGPWNP